MSLRSLSDQAILSRIVKLTRCERGVTLRVLQHLNEIERRRLHLKMGYSSMFVHCTAGLGCSASAAWRRIPSGGAPPFSSRLQVSGADCGSVSILHPRASGLQSPPGASSDAPAAPGGPPSQAAVRAA